MSKIIVPELGIHSPQCTVLHWVKQPGEAVKKGDTLLELSVEKTVYTLEAPETGVLSKIYAPIGAVLPQGEALGWISNNAAEKAPDLKPRLLDWDDTIAPMPNDFQPELPSNEQVTSVGSPRSAELKIIREERRLHHGKKLSGVLKRDISTRIKVSWQEVPKVDLFCDVNCSKYTEIKASLGKDGVPSYNAGIAWAVTRAFQAFPQYNLHWENGRPVPKNQIDVGLAVALKDELITVRTENTINLNMMEIHHRFRLLIRKALRLNLTDQEQFGSSLTITNLGEIGVKYFTPIINPPEVFILSVGAIQARVVPVDNKIEIVPMCTIGLSFDHRAINGAPAARLLQEIKRNLENLVV